MYNTGSSMCEWKIMVITIEKKINYRQQVKNKKINWRSDLIPNKEEKRRRKKKNNLLNLTNEGSKETQKQQKQATLSAENYCWFWASVEVHIQNSEWIGPKRCMRGKILKLE